MKKPQLKWNPAKVGCYWYADLGLECFAISTVITYENGRMILTYPKSGYDLHHNRNRVGRFKTLKAAQREAEQLCRRSALIAELRGVR
jgi:hypothetical protein